jgi:ABC-type multidrug transport system permease subunit
MTDKRSSAQTFALLVGAVFLLVGILGFIPGVVTEHDTKFLGQDGDSELLGIFQINFLHNLVHVIFGVAGIAAAKATGSARSFLLGGGVVYLVVFLYGVLIDFGSDANIINLNAADNVLHLLLGLGMVGLGLISGDARSTTGDRRTAAA